MIIAKLFGNEAVYSDGTWSSANSQTSSTLTAITRALELDYGPHKGFFQEYLINNLLDLLNESFFVLKRDDREVTEDEHTIY